MDDSGTHTRLKVLLVEDSPDDAELLVAAMERSGYAVEHRRVDTERDLRAALRERGWDVVISDWSMPTFDGKAALATVRELVSDLPFIIVSGTVGEERAVEALRAGAHDCISKDKLARVPPAVAREVREHQTRVAHRLAEVERHEAELRFSRIFESGIQGIAISLRSGKIIEANDAFLRLVGYDGADLRFGRLDWEQLTPPDWDETQARIADELRETGQVRPFEKEYLHKDGTRVPVLVGLAALDSERILSVVTDLGPQKQAERSAAALEKQLLQAQKLEAIGRLAGGVAHDFNNLLSVVLGYSELLLTDLKKNDPRAADLTEIRQAGMRAADLTRQLLLFSRQQVVEPRVIDLHDLIRAAEKMLKRILGEDVHLVSHLAAASNRVHADPGSIDQVVMNLAVNARDAMPTGGKLTMATENVVLDEERARALSLKPGKHLVLSVSDDGQGMDECTLARIFEPFFTTKERGKGTGLGLSTVFGIVQRFGGHVSVESAPQKGTTFHIHLPCVDARVDAAPPARKVSVRGSETVLLVEDEDQVRDIVRGILVRHGYKVIEARSADEALRFAGDAKLKIQLLLTDVVMPRMSGPELADRIKKRRPEVKVLCMSGYTDEAVTHHGLLSAAALLPKPITVDSLTRKVREVLDAP